VVCRIAILGDSSSSGIGLGTCCYPAKIYRILQNEVDAHITNCASPGFTSADASRYFHTELTKRHFDYVVIYLGNNEGASSARKGYYNHFKSRFSDYFSEQTRKKFRPVLSPSRFLFRYNVSNPTIASSPSEFRKNLNSIIGGAQRMGAKVIVINPIANLRFPSGLGAANSSYVCYLDELGELGYLPQNNPIDEISTTLANGLQSFALNRYAEAIKTWEPLASINNVAGFIARHNILCARALFEDGFPELQLQALLGEFPAYDSTIVYNLAQLKRLRGDQQKANELLEQAAELDISIYRIGSKYREVIANLAARNGVRIIDLGTMLNQFNFVDYCHPTNDGHTAIAHAVVNFIRSDGWQSNLREHSVYEVILPSPDYVSSPGQTLIEYQSIDWPIEKEAIAKAMTARRGEGSSLHNTEIVKCVENFFRSNKNHPVFTSNLSICGDWMPMSHEILSFPEYYVYRVLYNYYQEYEKSSILKDICRFDNLNEVLFRAKEYNSLILRESRSSLSLELDFRREYYLEIVDKIILLLTSSKTIYRAMIGERIRTIMTWYTREAFRYGTQSRVSMLYDRWEIEKLIEGIIVAVVIAEKLGKMKEIEELAKLLSFILELLQVHEKYARQYHQCSPSFSVSAYQTDLARIQASIIAHIDAWPGRFV